MLSLLAILLWHFPNGVLIFGKLLRKSEYFLRALDVDFLWEILLQKFHDSVICYVIDNVFLFLVDLFNLNFYLFEAVAGVFYLLLLLLSQR